MSTTRIYSQTLSLVRLVLDFQLISLSVIIVSDKKLLPWIRSKKLEETIQRMMRTPTPKVARVSLRCCWEQTDSSDDNASKKNNTSAYNSNTFSGCIYS